MNKTKTPKPENEGEGQNDNVMDRLNELAARLISDVPESVANVIDVRADKTEQTVTLTPLLTLTNDNMKLVCKMAETLGALTINTEKGIRWQFTANSKPKKIGTSKPSKEVAPKAVPTKTEKEADAQLDVPESEKPTEEQVIARAEKALGGSDIGTIIRQLNSILNALGDLCEDMAAIRGNMDRLLETKAVSPPQQRAAAPNINPHSATSPIAVPAQNVNPQAIFTTPQPNRMPVPEGADRYRSVEDVEAEFQAVMADVVQDLQFDVGQNDIIVKPKQFLGKEVWRSINDIVKGMGGAYVKVDARNTYWRVPKDKTQVFTSTQPAGQSNYPNREGGRRAVDANKPESIDESGIIWKETTTSKGKPSETAYDADNAGNVAFEELKRWVQSKDRAVAHGKFYYMNNYEGGVSRVDAAPPRRRNEGGGGYGGGGYRPRY